MKNLVELLTEVGKLKAVKRQGWVQRGINNAESVADHSFRLAVMAMILADSVNVNKNKCVKMALAHDLAEAIVGDITPCDNVDEERKHELEKQAINKMFKNFDTKHEILALWNEYNDNQSREAKFLHELDKVEMLLQAFEYKNQYKHFNFEEFWLNSKDKVKDPVLKKLLQLILK